MIRITVQEPIFCKLTKSVRSSTRNRVSGNVVPLLALRGVGTMVDTCHPTSAKKFVDRESYTRQVFRGNRLSMFVDCGLAIFAIDRIGTDFENVFRDI